MPSIVAADFRFKSGVVVQGLESKQVRLQVKAGSFVLEEDEVRDLMSLAVLLIKAVDLK